MKAMQGFLICAVALGVMTCSAVPAPAAQSVFGYSGLLFTPTTEVLAMRQVSLGAHYLDADGDPDSWMSFNIEAGLVPGLEVGLNVTDPDQGDSETQVNAKYELLKETQTAPSVAVGITGLGGDVLDECVYVVVGKSLNAPADTAFSAPRIYVGLGSDGPVDGLFVGFAAALAPRFTLMLEYDSDDINAGARFALSDTVRLHCGIFGGHGANFAVGLSFATPLP